MQRDRLVVVGLISVSAVLATCAALLASTPGQVRGYTGTPADILRVNVVNSGRTQALPVTIEESASPLKVEVSNKATVVLDPSTVVNARIQARTWEYKTVNVTPGSANNAQALNVEGAQGWEATGAVLTAPGGVTQLLLKRQK